MTDLVSYYLKNGDLADRVLATIAATERIALAAINSTDPVAWTTNLPKHPLRRYEAGVNAGLNTKIHVETNSLSCEAFDLVEHIARQDPQTTIRRCAADRRIVEIHRHGPTGCYHDDEIWPCPTIRALAEGYGITAREAP